MTVLDLDPPPSLRLVSNTGDAARDSRYRDSAPLYGPARSINREVLQAALLNRQPVHPDALRVVLATKQSTTAAPIQHFSASGIWQLMFVDVVTWCRNRKLELPPGCAQALTATIEHLAATETLDCGADDLDDLHDAIDECTGGWADGHPSTAPAGGRRSLRSSRGPKRT